MKIVASNKIQKMTTSIFQEVANRKQEAINRGIDVIGGTADGRDRAPSFFQQGQNPRQAERQ